MKKYFIALLFLYSFSCTNQIDNKIYTGESGQDGDFILATFEYDGLNLGEYIKKNRRNVIPTTEFQGIVTLSIIVEKDGSITNVEILKGICKVYDDEAIRIVKNLPLFKPALYNDKPVRSRLAIPIIFPYFLVK